MASVDTSAWDGPAAMSAATNSDDPAAAYEAICAGRRDGAPELQSSWALPHHKAPGDPPNADGVRNSLSRLPQTKGLTNADAAQAHLEAHLATIRDSEGIAASHEGELITLELPDEQIETLSVAQRRLGLRIVPYGVVAESKYGAIMFERGAFGEVDPTSVRLRMDHANPPTGKGVSFQDRADGAYMDFGVSKTQRGDEQLTLAVDGVSRGASVGFRPGDAESRTEIVNGRRVRVFGPASAVLEEVSTTWKPTFSEAGVMYVLHKEEKGLGQMAETKEAPASEPVEVTPTVVTPTLDLSAFTDTIAKANESLHERLFKMEERYRSEIKMPARSVVKEPKFHDWANYAIRTLTGQRFTPREITELALEDVITDDNPGLVPDAFKSNLLVNVIDTRRPFLDSTDNFPAPATGTTVTVPVVEQHSSADVQASEKSDVASQALQVNTQTFNMVTIAGGADVSIQMLKRSDPVFLDLLMRDLGAAYAGICEDEALAALEAAGMTAGTGTLDPEDLAIGEAWTNSIQNFGAPPDTIWLSGKAVALFIDAQNDGTNAPLYWNLNSNITVGAGAAGTISALKPVYVPALDRAGVHDVIIGPSQGFSWAESGTFELQVDVPSKAGRDIALVGMLFFCPRYPDAFTAWQV